MNRPWHKLVPISTSVYYSTEVRYTIIKQCSEALFSLFSYRASRLEVYSLVKQQECGYGIVQKSEGVLSSGLAQLSQSSNVGMQTWWKAFVRNSCHLSSPNGGWLGLSWVSDSLSKTLRATNLKPAVLLLDLSALLDCCENVRRDIAHVHHGSRSSQSAQLLTLGTSVSPHSVAPGSPSWPRFALYLHAYRLRIWMGYPSTEMPGC